MANKGGNKKKQIQVELIEAKQLLPMDANGKSDPFVQVTIGKNVQKSQTIPNTLNPQWNEKFTMPVTNPDTDTIKFDVFDSDVTKASDPLGSAQMPLTSLKEGRQDFWLPLQGKKSSGSIHVSLTPINFGITGGASTGKAPDAAVPRADTNTVTSTMPPAPGGSVVSNATVIPAGGITRDIDAGSSSPVAAHTGTIHNNKKAHETANKIIKDISGTASSVVRDHPQYTAKAGTDDLRRSIELAAYYKAETSGWSKSQEQCWLEAEREVKAMLQGTDLRRM